MWHWWRNNTDQCQINLSVLLYLISCCILREIHENHHQLLMVDFLLQTEPTDLSLGGSVSRPPWKSALAHKRNQNAWEHCVVTHLGAPTDECRTSKEKCTLLCTALFSFGLKNFLTTIWKVLKMAWNIQKCNIPNPKKKKKKKLGEKIVKKSFFFKRQKFLTKAWAAHECQFYGTPCPAPALKAPPSTDHSAARQFLHLFVFNVLATERVTASPCRAKYIISALPHRSPQSVLGVAMSRCQILKGLISRVNFDIVLTFFFHQKLPKVHRAFLRLCSSESQTGLTRDVQCLSSSGSSKL